MDKTTYALKRALNLIDYLEYEKGLYFHGDRDVIREAMANIALERMSENERELGIQMQPAQQQEPVAWVDLLKEAEKIVRGKVLWKRFIDGTPLANDIAVWMADFAQQHTSPQPSKPFVGLTNRDIYECEPKTDWYDSVEFARAIEAKLREKNA